MRACVRKNVYSVHVLNERICDLFFERERECVWERMWG